MSFFTSSIGLPETSSNYYVYKNIFIKNFKQNKNFKLYTEEKNTMSQGQEFYLILEQVYSNIVQELTAVSFNFLSEENFNNESEYYIQLIKMSYHLLFDFLNVEKEKLALENYLSNSMTINLKQKFLQIIDICFENIMVSKIFLVSKQIKLDLLSKVNSTNYPIFFSFLEENINSAKEIFIKSFYEKIPKDAQYPPIVKINTENPIDVSFDTTTNTYVITQKKEVERILPQNTSREPKSISDYMVTFDFNSLNQRRKNVLNRAYECLEWRAEEPIPYCMFENVILFIGMNKDHPEIEEFIQWSSDAISFFLVPSEDTGAFSIDFVERRLFSIPEENDFYDDSLNWFSFNNESPYKKLMAFNQSVLVFSNKLYFLNKNNLLQLLEEYNNSMESPNPNQERIDQIYNILSYYFALGALVEPGSYFSKRPNSLLFDLWNEQILGLSRTDYISQRDLYRRVSNSKFICSNSMAYCVAFVKYCYKDFLTQKEKEIYGERGELIWFGCKYVSHLLRKNKREVKDLKKLKPGDIVYDLHGHFLILVDLIFENFENEEYVTFYFIHGNGWGYQPLLKKYTEGVLLDCENTPMSDYVKYDYWNQYGRTTPKKRIRVQNVFKVYNFFNLLD